MIIGVTINNILRDHISKLKLLYEEMYEKEIESDINPYDLEKTFPTIEYEEKDIDFDKDFISTGITEVVEEGFDVYEFIYSEASFEVFGRSEEIEAGSIMKLSKLSNENEDIKIIFLNRDSPRSKCATLFFLSKNGFDLEEIKFPNSWEDFWNHCDYLVTDNPKIIEARKGEAKLIKFENKFNVDYNSDYSIINIEELILLINKIKEKK